MTASTEQLKPGLVLFGASSATGRAVLDAWRRRRGTGVVAAARRVADAEPGVSPVACDALDRADVDRAFAAAPADAAVVSVLGGKPGGAPLVDDAGNRNVIDAAGPNRHIVLVTSLGCGDTADLVSDRLRRAIGDVLEAKTAAERHLRDSGGRFTIVRPGGLMDGPATGTAGLQARPEGAGLIRRADLAELVVGLIGSDAHVGGTYAALDPELEPPARG